VIRAYVWRNGVIEFGPKLPDHVLPICKGPARVVRPLVRVLSRQAYDGKTMLMPGIPEAKNDWQAANALLAFRNAIKQRNRPGVVIG
jgi:hypothetical protein